MVVVVVMRLGSRSPDIFYSIYPYSVRAGPGLLFKVE